MFEEHNSSLDKLKREGNFSNHLSTLEYSRTSSFNYQSNFLSFFIHCITSLFPLHHHHSRSSVMTAIKRVLEACPHEYYSKQMPFGSNSRITLSPDAMYEVWLFWCAYLFPRKAISLYKRNCQAADLSSCATYLLDHCFLNGSTLRAYTLELD